VGESLSSVSWSSVVGPPARRFCDEIEAILGEADANRETRIAGGPNRFGHDGFVEGDAGFVQVRGVEDP
jgi:hypothetical protein